MVATPSAEVLKDWLRGHHCSWTRSRAAVFNSLQRSPATLSELAERLHRDVDRATVYRTVTLFEGLDVVQRIWAGWKSVIELTDRFSPHHHHLVCENCEKLIDFEDKTFEAALTKAASTQGFQVTHHHVELFGLCPNCQSKA